jgi:hypothetical protein
MNMNRKAVFSKLTFGILLLLTVCAAQAQTAVPIAVDKEILSTVKYIGMQDDMVIFSVAYQNPNGLPFSVILKDQDGTQLYQSIFKEKDFNKQFRLPRADKSKVVFIIRDFKGSDIAKTFEINVNRHYIAEVAVKKVN